MSHRRSLAMLALVAGALALFVAQAGSSAEAKPPTAGQKLEKVKHVVVIYEENHSFDNLYGGWEGVNGLRERDRGAEDAGQPGRHAVHLPPAGRREPHLSAAGPSAATRRQARRSRVTS